MKFKKKNGLYIPQHYMGCMGIEDQFPFKWSKVTALRKGVKSPSGGGGTTGGSAGSSTAGITRIGVEHHELIEFPYIFEATVPVGTTLMVLFDCGYSSGNNRMTAANMETIHDFIMDYTALASGAYVSIGHLFIDAAHEGSQTINITKAGMEYNSIIFGVYYSGVGSIGDIDGTNASGSITLTTAVGNVVILGASGDDDPAWTNATQIDTHVTGSALYGETAQMTADGLTETISHNAATPAIAGIVLVAA